MDGDNGLICAYVLDGEGGGDPLDWDGMANWKPGQGALWVHLDHAAEGARYWIRETSGLDQAVGSILLAKETRPRSLDLTLGFLVLPLGFITELFGTNLLGAPGAGHPSGFAILISAEAALVVVVVLIFRWLRWL